MIERVLFIVLFTIGATFGFMAIMKELGLPWLWTGFGFTGCTLNILIALDIIVNDQR